MLIERLDADTGPAVVFLHALTTQLKERLHRQDRVLDLQNEAGIDDGTVLDGERVGYSKQVIFLG